MKACNYISESIVLVTPTAGDPFRAKLVTEYGRDSSGGLIVVSTRYVDSTNAVITLPAGTTSLVAVGQPVAAQKDCIISTEVPVCADGQPLRMVTEYGFDATGGLIAVSTRYVDTTNTVQVPGASIVYGACKEYAAPIFSNDIASVLAGGAYEGQFLYITDTGDEYGQITEVYTWIGGMWSPYPVPLALWSNTTGTLTNVFNTEPVNIETNDPVNGGIASLGLGANGTATLYGSDKVILNSGGEYEFIGVPEDTDESATKALVYNPSTYKVEYKDLLAIAGDRYKTVSSSCITIVSTGTVTFMVEPNLAYTPQQDIIALADVGNSMSGEVVSYNDITGELVMDVQHKEGAGTFCNWILNIDAVKLAAVSVYYGTGSPIAAGQVGVEGDLWYVTTNTAAPSEENVTEHWVYDWSLGWKRVWKKEYMFEIQLTDSFDATYYFYGGDVGPDWQIHRYNHISPANPLYMIPQIAELSNNSGYATLAAAWAARTTLNYA